MNTLVNLLRRARNARAHLSVAQVPVTGKAFEPGVVQALQDENAALRAKLQALKGLEPETPEPEIVRSSEPCAASPGVSGAMKERSTERRSSAYIDYTDHWC